MTVESVTCEECGEPVPLDDDHGHIVLKKVRTNVRDGQEDYYLHDR